MQNYDCVKNHKIATLIKLLHTTEYSILILTYIIHLDVSVISLTDTMKPEDQSSPDILA